MSSSRYSNGIISNYPLSQVFKEQLEAYTGQDTVWMTLTELRQLPFWSMIRRLASYRVDNLYIPVEAGEGRAIWPILRLISALVQTNRRATIDEYFEQRSFNRRSLVWDFLQLVKASIASVGAMLLARRTVAALASRSRMETPKTAGQKVMFLNANLWFGVKAGGSVGHISGVVNALDKLKHVVRYVAAGGRLLVRDNIEYVRLKEPVQFGLPVELNYYRFDRSVVEQITRSYDPGDVDFIYQRLSVCNFSGVELSRYLQRPLILEYNGSEVWVARNWGRPLRTQKLAEQCEDVALKHAHMIVTISDVLRDELLDRGVPAERIVSYPNCIDPEIFDPRRFTDAEITAIRNRHAIPADGIVVTFVGTFGQWHGAPILAEAAHILLENRAEWVSEQKLYFLFVGDGVRMPDVKAALGRHISSPHVVLAGLVPQAEAPAYLAASDILSSPHVANADGSRFFGSPTKLFEYMAMDRAIIASDLDQIGEVLSGSVPVSALSRDGVPEIGAAPAILATPGSAEDIVEAVIFLTQRPEARAELGANARARALANYTWEHHVSAILDQMKALSLIEASGVEP